MIQRRRTGRGKGGRRSNLKRGENFQTVKKERWRLFYSDLRAGEGRFSLVNSPRKSREEEDRGGKKGSFLANQKRKEDGRNGGSLGSFSSRVD